MTERHERSHLKDAPPRVTVTGAWTSNCRRGLTRYASLDLGVLSASPGVRRRDLLVALELAREKAEHVTSYYRRYPEMIDTIARRVGYRVRPHTSGATRAAMTNGLVVGFANDGIAGVPGVLHVEVTSDGSGRRRTRSGYPLPGRSGRRASSCHGGETSGACICRVL